MGFFDRPRHRTATASGLIWVSKLEIDNLRILKDRYTIKPKFKNLDPVPVYEERDGFFGYPRHSGIVVDHLSDATTEGTPVNVRFLATLRENQVPVMDEFEEKIRTKRDLILEADTGAGKTVLMLGMWAKLGCTCLVIVPKTDLVNQWRERILEFTDLPSERIGVAQQDLCEYRGKSIVIGMIHSVCKDKYPDAFKQYFGLVIFDELHKLGAFYFSRVGGMFPARRRIGATATLKRSDGLETVFHYHLGREIIKPKKSVQPVPKVAVFRYTKSSGNIPKYLSETISRRGVLLSRLSKNTDRTTIISNLANQIISSGRQTLVVSERIPQLEEIRENLIQEHGHLREKVGLYLGKTSKTERLRVASECTCILATMSMLSLGTDIPTLRGLVFATPVSQVAQPVGRIRRIKEGEKDPIVVDFFDSAYEETKRWYNNRVRFYNSIGCDIHYL